MYKYCLAIAGALVAASFAQARADSGLEMPHIPYIPSPPKLVDRMLEIAQVGPGDYVIDLGSGDGRIPIAAAKRGARGFGVEIDEKLVALARENAKEAGVADRVEFRVQDLFETELAGATVLTLYLPTVVNIELRPRILSELKPGTRIVAHEFALGEWRADLRERLDGRNIHFWLVPAKVDGIWEIQAGDRSFTLEFGQRFQEIYGIAIVGRQTYRLQGPWLHGEEIEFVVDLGDGPEKFSGTVRGDRMEPRGSSTGAKWQGTRTGPVPFGGP
jgi:SAM-dependent methyltransferase